MKNKLVKSFLIIIPSLLLTACTIKLDGTGSTTTIENPTVARPMMGQNSFGVDVCNDAPSDWVAKTLNKEVFGTRDYSTQTNTGCEYYLDKEKNGFLAIVVNYSNAETQKKGHEVFGRKIRSESSIPMENFVAIQDDGIINAIYIIMDREKYVRVDRSSGTDLSNEVMVSFASKLAEEKILK
jgi:hypothetical protein